MSDVVDLFVKCSHMQSERCTSPLALPLYGDSPSPGVCRICPHYEGFPRGLGDVVETAARLTGLKAIADFRAARKAPKASARPKGAAGQCGGCAARRQALNEAVPFSKNG
jgi:hypothetical protein